MEEKVINELYHIFGESNIINIIKISRLRWAGHIVRMEENECNKRLINSNPGGQGGGGRPKLRCMDGVENDLRKITCRNWKPVTQFRTRW